MRRIPFALEKGTPMKRIHSLRRGGSPCGESIHLEKGTPLKRIPFAVERGGTPWVESHPLGEGDPLEAKPFAMERGNPLKATPTC